MPRRTLAVSVFTLLALGASAATRPSLAQTVAVGDALEDYLRLLQISGEASLGSFTVRPLPIDRPGGLVSTPDHPWQARFRPGGEGDASGVRIAPIESRLRVFANSRQPAGGNDGIVWQGKGLTTALDVGTSIRWRNLTVAIRPTLLYSQNSDFELAPVGVQGMPAYAYPWRRIDLPQRFGPDALWTLDLGESEVRLELGGAALGVGARNRWWGPGIRNGIVLSNNAGGFPHAFLGTDGPRDIGIGRVEANWIWGRLGQSDWFDPDVANTERFLTGLVLAYSPSFLEGLSVGATRVFYGLVPPGGVPFGDYFMALQGVRKEGLVGPANPTGDDEQDQLLSLFARWVLTESAFEVYGEWARNDHSWNFTDLLLEPEHSQGYTLGLQKRIPLASGRFLSLGAELTHLERGRTIQVRASPVYYSHHIVTQGYTHRGQALGAEVGPGGNSQFLGIVLYDAWGRAGVTLQRKVHDNDAYYVWAEANDAAFFKHNVSFDLGAHALLFVDDFDLEGGLILTRELNRYFDGPDVWNVNLSLSARWRPR